MVASVVPQDLPTTPETAAGEWASMANVAVDLGDWEISSLRSQVEGFKKHEDVYDLFGAGYIILFVS